MHKSFEEVKAAMETILTVDVCAQVKVVNQEWCYGMHDYIYVYDGTDKGVYFE